MRNPVTFKEAYEASLRQQQLIGRISPLSPYEEVCAIFDRAIVDEYLVALKMEGGTGIEEARAWVREMHGIYGSKKSQPVANMETVRNIGNAICKAGRILAEARTEKERDSDEEFAKIAREHWEMMESGPEDEADFDLQETETNWHGETQERQDDKGERYKVVGILPQPAERKRPDEWCEILGERIMDPDGWRGHMYQAWTQPITKAEFQWRAQHSTKALNARERNAAAKPIPADEPPF